MVNMIQLNNLKDCKIYFYQYKNTMQHVIFIDYGLYILLSAITPLNRGHY